jgi:fructoselysine 3-epimerase
MRIGLFSSGYRRYPLEIAFRDAKEFGYDYIELWGGRPHAYPLDLNRGRFNDILKLIDYFQVPVEVYTPEHNDYPFNYMCEDPMIREDSLNYLKTAIQMGKTIGAKYVLISAGHGGNYRTEEELRTQVVECLRELANYGEKCNQHLLLEALTPYESNVCNRAEQLSGILKQVNSPILHGMCDVVPAFVQHQPIEDYFFHLADDLKHFHLIDSDGVSDTHLLPGDGRIPLNQVSKMLKSRGYLGGVTIELVSAYMNEPSLYARKAIESVKKLGY